MNLLTSLRRGVRLLAGIVILAAGSSTPSPCQQSILFQHLTVKEGLSQGTVLCILQDRQGLMWFGTQDGLNRYDGYTMTVFRHTPDTDGTLNDNFIVLLAEDTSGVLWVGTLNSPATLNRFDPVTETFREYPADSVNLRGGRINAARSQYEDRSGVRWYGVKDGGLKRVDPRTGATTTFRHAPSDPASLVHDDVFQIVEDRSGTLWVSTAGGLDRFDPKTETFTHFRHREGDPKTLSDDFTWPLLLDRSGDLWVGTYSGGLNHRERSAVSFSRYRHRDADPRSLAGDRIYALYQDRSGMIWVGTGDQGVDRFHPELSAFSHHLHEPGDPASLSDNNIQSICVDDEGRVWIGTRDGLNRWDRSTGTFVAFRHDKNNPRSIGDDNAPALLVDRSGTLWIGTGSNGLDQFQPGGGGSFSHFRHNPSDPPSLSDNRIVALCEDRKGYIWIATYGGGVNLFDPRTRTFRVYRHNPSDSTSLGTDAVFCLMEDRSGSLWIGTYDGGLERLDPATGTFTHYRHDAADSTSISDMMVLSLCEDRSGILWIGTTAGLNRFDPQAGTFQHYREKDGLANDMVFGILEDTEGNLWMSTNKGLSRFNPRTQQFHTYDYTDGLQGNEFNQGAYAMDPRTREMFFGGPNGFNVFLPENVRNNPFVPPVVLSSFTRYNTDDNQGRPIEGRGIGVATAIEISYKDNIVSFEFAALNYWNSFKNNYAYKLEGFSDNWIQLGTDRRATFTNLDGGEYLLHVKGSNNDGVWNEEGATLNITVTPPWWKTTWAYGTYALMFVAFLYVTRRFELNRQKQKARIRESELHTKAVEAEKRALEAENERKTKELEDARQLQLSMLPKEVPHVPDYEIAVFMRTATEVGGDYYDFSVTPEGTLNVALGDATGHGMQAGTIVTLMKGLFVSEASKFDIQTFFQHCSRAIKDIKLGRLYMALTLARFGGNTVSLSSAGMPPAYLHRKKTGAIDEILLKAVPLGSMRNFPYSLYETEMEGGDTLLLLTDGLPEQKNAGQDMFDYARVVESFKNAAGHTPDGIISHLVNEGERWMKDAVQDDDITLLVIRRKDDAV